MIRTRVVGADIAILGQVSAAATVEVAGAVSQLPNAMRRTALRFSTKVLPH